jgi:type VI secretion system protein ImpE
MNPREAYRAGDLKGAIAGMNEEVRQHPTDTSRRGFLCELLCFAGELDRADKLLDTLAAQDPQSTLGIAAFRHLIRAEQARQQFHTEGRLPEFLGQPSPVLQLHLQASIHVREGKLAEAAALLEQAESQRPHTIGTCDGKPFDDLRDLDDLTSAFFEVLTSNGKYYWVPVDRVQHMEFRAPERPHDLLWVRVHMIVRDGPDGEVFLPTLYAGTHADSEDRFRLGRATDWRGGDGSPMKGVGLRTFLVGDEDRTILSLKEIVFNSQVVETPVR